MFALAMWKQNELARGTGGKRQLGRKKEKPMTEMKRDDASEDEETRLQLDALSLNPSPLCTTT